MSIMSDKSGAATIRTQYGGCQFAQVSGVQDGKGIMNIGMISIPDATPFSDEQLLQSELGKGLYGAKVNANGMYRMFTEETHFGVPSGNPTNTSARIPEVDMISRKVVGGEQSGVGPTSSKGNPDVDMVAQKVVAGVQTPITPGQKASPKQ